MKKVIAIILLVLLLGVLLAGLLHARTHLQIVKRYLEQNRPDVVAAIEGYRRENGKYPDSITNAVPRYYKGRQERLYFLESYGYRNLGTNYYLKHFSSNPLPAAKSRRPFCFQSLPEIRCSMASTGLALWRLWLRERVRSRSHVPS